MKSNSIAYAHLNSMHATNILTLPSNSKWAKCSYKTKS